MAFCLDVGLAALDYGAIGFELDGLPLVIVDL